jgi:hypothetical protein
MQHLQSPHTSSIFLNEFGLQDRRDGLQPFLKVIVVSMYVGAFALPGADEDSTEKQKVVLVCGDHDRDQRKHLTMLLRAEDGGVRFLEG